MYTNTLLKKWVAPISLASLLVASQLPTSLIAHAEESKKVSTVAKNTITGKTVNYKNALTSSSAFLYSITPNPKYGHEYVIINLARSNYPVAKNYYEQYYENLVKALKEKDGNIGRSYSDYANIILALNAIDKEPTAVGGYNLLEKMLDKYVETKPAARTFTQTALVLLALKSDNYSIPNSLKYQDISKDTMIKELLKGQNKDNGFGWTEGVSSDPDTTSMILIALADYMEQEEVASSVEKALPYLQDQLNERAGITTPWIKGDNAASIAQVIMSLVSLNIDPKTEYGFVKKGGFWTVQNLVSSIDPKTGGIKMSPLEDKVDAGFATQQGNRALAMYDRFEAKDKTTFYDMTDAKAENLAYDMIAEKPTVNSVADNKTTITGKTEPYATITVKTGSKVIGTAQADFKGSYSIKIKKQKAGTTLSITATDLANNKSKVVSVKVIDKTAPQAPKVNRVADNKTTITGKTEPYATITIKKVSKVIGTAKANSKGYYSVKIKKQKAGTKLSLTATDRAKNKSKITSVKVLDKTAPKAPKVKKVTKKSTKIAGTAEAKAKVYVLKNKKAYKTGTVSSKGKFSVSIKKQKVGTKLTVYVKDAAKNKSASKTIIVKSK